MYLGGVISMNYLKWKEVAVDLLVDIIASMAIAVGVYNFALNANFPVAGFSGMRLFLCVAHPQGARTLSVWQSRR